MPSDAAAVGEGIERMARRMGFAPTCLAKALALQQLLAWHGIAADVRLGLRRTPQGLDGHAWVECAGEPVGDDKARLAEYAACETS